MKPTWIIASTAIHEAARRKILAVAVLAGGAYLAVYALGLHAALRNERHAQAAQRAAYPARQLVDKEAAGMLMLVGLFGADSLLVMMAVLTSIDAIPGEITSGTIQAIASKPISRRVIVAGKALGFLLMMTGYLLLMAGGTLLIVRWIGGFTPPHILGGLALMWLEGALLILLTFLWGTMFSTLTSGVLTLGLHGLAFMAGWIEQIGTLTHTAAAVRIAVLASLVMPSESLWRRAAYEMQPPLLTAAVGGPFLTLSVPSPAMIVYAALFTLAAFLLAIRRFSLRDF
jgi:Cu-processing system permease protein